MECTPASRRRRSKTAQWGTRPASAAPPARPPRRSPERLRGKRIHRILNHHPRGEEPRKKSQMNSNNGDRKQYEIGKHTCIDKSVIKRTATLFALYPNKWHPQPDLFRTPGIHRKRKWIIRTPSKNRQRPKKFRSKKNECLVVSSISCRNNSTPPPEEAMI